MSGYQRILVVSTAVGDDALVRVRGDLRSGALVLAAPTPESQRVVGVLGVQARPETLLTPVRSPQVDRGHRLDDLVRAHAMRDRFRDVVVVTDPATATLLLRVLAPDQLFSATAVTVVGLVRGERPVDVRRGLVVGVALGLVAGVSQSVALILTLLGALASAGLVLLLLESWRHVGRELLLAAGTLGAVALVVVASAARFPGGF